jgi:hypothetical protein
MTGSIPGIAASTKETFEFGSLPNSVEAPEKNQTQTFPLLMLQCPECSRS